MAWTYPALKTAADALVGVVGFQAQADALNAQVQALINRATTYGAVRAILKQAPTGDWAKIVARSKTTATLPPVTGADIGVLAAILLVSVEDADVLDPNLTAFWTQFTSWMGNLATLGDLSAASRTAVLALISGTGPVWLPAITPRDIWIAQGQPA